MQEQQITITEDNTEAVFCGECKSPIFEQCVMMRKVSALLSPSGKEEMIQLPVMCCKNCGTPMMEGM